MSTIRIQPVKPDSQKAVSIRLDKEASLFIGRATECGLNYADIKSVSAKHVVLRSSKGNLQLKSLSSNKTYLDGKEVPRDMWVSAKAGQVIALVNSSTVTIKLVAATAKLTDLASAREDQSHLPICATLRSLNAAVSSLDIRYSEPRTVVSIGRGESCSLIVPCRKVSTTHATILVTRLPDSSMSVLVKSLKQSSPVFIDDAPVGEDGALLESGQLLSLVYPASSDKAVAHFQLLLPGTNPPLASSRVYEWLSLDSPSPKRARTLDSSPPLSGPQAELARLLTEEQTRRMEHEAEVAGLMSALQRLQADVDATQRIVQADQVREREDLEKRLGGIREQIALNEERHGQQVGALVAEHVARLATLHARLQGATERMAELKMQHCDFDMNPVLAELRTEEKQDSD